MPYFLRSKSESNKGFMETKVHINDLNDDCLIQIFSHLTNALDLYNLKLVCQKWRDLCPYAWRMKKKIEIQNYFDVEFFKKATFHCRKNVTHLIFNNWSYLKHKKEIKLYLEFLSTTISSYEHLQHLFFTDLLGSCKLVEKLLLNIPTSNLSYFEVFEWQDLTDEMLAPFLSAATGLKTLLLDTTTRLRGHSLLQLSNKCTYLGITWCMSLDRQVTINVFKKLSNLEKLKMEGDSEISLDILLHIPNLIYLNANYSHLFNTFDSDLDPSQFNVPPFLKLKVLVFRGNQYVNRNKLLVFTRLYPNLEDLDISGCFPGSDSEGVDEVEAKFDLGPLAKFEYLKILKCDGLDVVDSIPSASEKFKALEVLECDLDTIGTELTKRELLWMVDLCPNLRLIKLWCKYEKRYRKVAQLVNILNIIYPRVLNIFLRIPELDHSLSEVVKRELQDHHPNLHLNGERIHDCYSSLDFADVASAVKNCIYVFIDQETITLLCQILEKLLSGLVKNICTVSAASAPIEQFIFF